MFEDLIKKKAVKIRGREMVFHEIGSLAWVEKVMLDDSAAAKNQSKKPKELSAAEARTENNQYAARVVAASLELGVEASFDELYESLSGLPSGLLGEMFDVADEVNDLSGRAERLRGKDGRADATPES